jgi:hypothetical protein
MSTSECLLKPYLDATLALTHTSLTPLFTLFYIYHPPLPSSNHSSATTCLTTPPKSVLLSESADSSATIAESLFWEASTILKSLPQHATKEIDRMWPLVDVSVEDDADEW